MEDADLCFGIVTAKLFYLSLVNSALTLVINICLIYFPPRLISGWETLRAEAMCTKSTFDWVITGNT